MTARRKLEEVVEVKTSEPLHVKYRPQHLGNVLGQKAIVKSLSAALKAAARPHCFLFTGPRGTGKTTLGRIIGNEFKCDMIEVDAASNTGIDDMREVTAALRYHGFGETPNKAIIIDECHRLSGQAWDSLLKITEDTPPHVYFVFCSTNPSKIPTTMVSRCLAYNLALLRFDDLMDILEDVCEAEDYTTPKQVLTMIAQACEGSAREALTMLAVVYDSDIEDVPPLLQLPGTSKEVIDLCRMMVKGDLTWQKLTATLKSMTEPAETVRIICCAYLTSCLMGARNDTDTVRWLDMLEVFLKPTNPQDKMAPILVAFGRFMLP